jgi:excisionase family DNA binding protein
MQTNSVGDTICAKKAAALLGCSTWTLYEHCKAGKIPHFRLGRHLRFRRSTIEAWLAECEAKSLSSLNKRLL